MGFSSLAKKTTGISTGEDDYMWHKGTMRELLERITLCHMGTSSNGNTPWWEHPLMGTLPDGNILWWEHSLMHLLVLEKPVSMGPVYPTIIEFSCSSESWYMWPYHRYIGFERKLFLVGPHFRVRPQVSFPGDGGPKITPRLPYPGEYPGSWL